VVSTLLHKHPLFTLPSLLRSTLIYGLYNHSIPITVFHLQKMASTIMMNRLMQRRVLASVSSANGRVFPAVYGSVASFSTTPRRLQEQDGPNLNVPKNKLPPPPKDFRLKYQPSWGEKESALDVAGRYFLLAEMMRGMYVVLEQFFRQP